MGGGSLGVTNGVDFGCHFFRSGAGGISVVEGCGFAGVAAMGCSSDWVGGGEVEGTALGCHFFLSGEGAVGVGVTTGRDGISAIVAGETVTEAVGSAAAMGVGMGSICVIVVVRPLLRRTPSRSSSATSLMAMSSDAALLGVLPSMLLQKGQPTARIFSPEAEARVSWTSRKRLSEIRSSPGSSSFQNWAPPAPQQKAFSRVRGSSGVVFERMLRRLRGAS